MPDQKPVWDIAFPKIITITEKTKTEIQVSAIDGDYGINNDITYTVEDESKNHENIFLGDLMFYSILDKFATVDAKSGLITVSPIDKDKGFDQVTLTVTAIEVQQPNSTLVGTIRLIIEDIDDSITRFKTNLIWYM
jgi:hypothetical protein